MLDPSIPWLASGYKNFQSEDISKTHSYDDITKLYHVNQEDFIKKELRSSTPELRQRRRVKSATIERQLHRKAGNERPPRPKTALGIASMRNYDGLRSESSSSLLGGSPGTSPNRLGGRSRTRPKSCQSYYREKVGCYDYTSEHPLPQSLVETPNKPRPKSAILIRHRPSSLDRKSVSLVERQHYKERMTYGIAVEEESNHCAFCPTEAHSGFSSTSRPTSSTGLVAASLPTQYDRYTFWTRPRTAPSTKREFQQQKPRHNYVNRGRVPHYTNFVKRIDLGLRDQTPSPPPTRIRKAFEEPVKPAPPREPRERPKSPRLPIPEPPKEPVPPPPVLVESEDVEEELVALEEPADEVAFDEPIRIPTPTPVEEPPEEELPRPPETVSTAWTEPRAPTPTPTSSPPPEEEERIPTPPPPREPTPPPPEPEPEPIPEPPKEPTPPPTPPREPTPPPPPEPEPEPAPPEEPSPPTPPKPKKEVRIHDPPVTEPPPRPLIINKKEKKSSNLVKRPAAKPEVIPKPPPEPKPEPVKKEPVKVVKEEPKPPPPKPVEVPSLPKLEIKVEEPKPVVVETPEPEVSKPPEEPPKDEPKEEETKKQLGPPPPKVKVDIFGRSMDPEQLLDLEMKSRRKGQEDDDEEFEYTGSYGDADPIPDSKFKKSKIESWLKGRMALSKRASRFELPMDVRDLEGMAPITYLERYCIVNRRRAALYRRAFNRVDKDCDMIINQKEMEKAIEDALVDTVHTDQINYVLNMIEAEHDIKIRPKLFSAICALLERLFYHEFVTEDTAEMEGNTKERVESADFSALDWKLEGCTVNPPLKKLLYRLL